MGSVGRHKGSIHKKLCTHYAWIFTHCPGKKFDAEQDVYFTIRPNPLSLLPKGH